MQPLILILQRDSKYNICPTTDKELLTFAAIKDINAHLGTVWEKALWVGAEWKQVARIIKPNDDTRAVFTDDEGASVEHAAYVLVHLRF
jgi:hypothetical protein